jgi:hypothetical protein
MTITIFNNVKNQTASIICVAVKSLYFRQLVLWHQDLKLFTTKNPKLIDHKAHVVGYLKYERKKLKSWNSLMRALH